MLNYSDGNQIGWMVHLLPYIEEQAVYNQIDQAAGVYDAKNRLVRQVGIKLLHCPSWPSRSFGDSDWRGSIDPSTGKKRERPQPSKGDRGARQTTNYAGCVGDEEKPIDEDRQGIFILNRNIRVNEITDGLTHTLFAGEKLIDDFDLGWMSGTSATLRNTGTPWRRANGPGGSRVSPLADYAGSTTPAGTATNVVDTATFIDPSRIDEPALQLALKNVGGFGSHHATVCNFLFGDGAVRSLAQDIDARAYQLLGNRSDGDLLLNSPTREAD